MNRRKHVHPLAGLLLMTALSCFSIVVKGQKPIDTPVRMDFEGMTIAPWVSVGNAARVTDFTSKVGNQSLEITSGSSAQCAIKLRPNSTYQISLYVKTAGGSDEALVNIKGMGANNISAASALADWTLIEREFNAGEGQTNAIIEIANTDNPAKNSIWIDDVEVKRLRDYEMGKVAGIQPFPARLARMDQGIETQSNEKLNWLLDAKFGMFIHWGLYAGPARGEWVMHNAAMSPEEYRKFAYPESGDMYFAADKFDADQWARLAKSAGMKYMNLTTQHHDGYALFESKYMNAFTSKQTHNRDFVKEYVEACRNHGLKVGLYKTLINWRFPGYYDVTGADCKENKFGYTTDSSHKENARLMKEELFCQVRELMTNYGKIDQIFWDGGWLAQQGTDAAGAYFWEPGKYLDPGNEWPVNWYFQDIDDKTDKPLGLMGIVRKYQPDVLVNPRSGWYGDYKSEEGSAPVTGPVRTEELYEKCMSIGHSWGYNPSMEDTTKLKSADQIKRMLSDCVVRNMTLLLNVGPDRHGWIPAPIEKILLSTGQWLEQVGDAVYGTRGGPWNPRDGVYGFAYKDNKIFVYLLNDFIGDSFTLPSVNKGQKPVRAYMTADNKPVKVSQNKAREITLSGFDRSDKAVSIITVELNKNVMDH